MSGNLAVDIPRTNTGTGTTSVSSGYIDFFGIGESSLTANNAINTGGGTGCSLVLGYAPSCSEKFSNEVADGSGIHTDSGVSLDLTLSRNFGTGGEGSGADDGGNGADNSAFSENSSALNKSTSTSSKGIRHSSSTESASSSNQNQRAHRRKADNTWSIEEHLRFLEGLFMEGSGRWKLIAEKYVPTRTPTQVGSHAQKYFLKQQQSKEKANKKQRSGPHVLEITQLPPDYVPVSDRKHKEALAEST